MSVRVPAANPRRPQLAFPPGPLPGLSEARPHTAGQSGARQRPAWALVRGGRSPPVAGSPRRRLSAAAGGGSKAVEGSRRGVGFVTLPLARVRVGGLPLLPGTSGQGRGCDRHPGQAPARRAARRRPRAPGMPRGRGGRREREARRKWSPPGGLGAARRAPGRKAQPRRRLGAGAGPRGPSLRGRKHLGEGR